MSYMALYRKFRPTVFSDVKGQDPIVTTLQNQIKADRIGHAYLFCGTRGTGKTTVAKIFAKAVNCEHPVDGNPCGECATCRSIADGDSLNVIEIDAASNNGVDNIRQIREEVAYRPTQGKYKVYIIDEAHMLSTGAFNALLKTLEEPPEYVIFILATTEASKIPVTISSRCQRYDFRRISMDTMVDRMKELMEQEQVEVEDRALRYIAKVADGSMRDALSLLDQCLAYQLDEKLTYDQVLEVLGAVDTDVFSQLLRLILDRDVPKVLDLVEDLVMQGRELTQLTDDFTWYLRNLLLVKTSDSDQIEETVDVSQENMAQLREEAKMIEEDTLLRDIRIFSELSDQLKTSTQKRVTLEVALIKLCTPAMESESDTLLERIRVLEEKVDAGSFSPKSSNPPQEMDPSPVTLEKTEDVEREQEAFKEEPESFKDQEAPSKVTNLTQVIEHFGALTASLPAPVSIYLKDARPELGDHGQLVIYIKNDLYLEKMNQEEHIRELQSAVEEKTGQQVDIEIRKVGDVPSKEEKIPDLNSVINMEITVEE